MTLTQACDLAELQSALGTIKLHGYSPEHKKNLTSVSAIFIKQKDLNAVLRKLTASKIAVKHTEKYLKVGYSAGV